MTVALSKGESVSLSKEAPGLIAITVGLYWRVRVPADARRGMRRPRHAQRGMRRPRLGWNPRVTADALLDIDASVFVCGEDGKVRSDADFIFYNNMTGLGGAVQHAGESSWGDDEQIKIDLSKIPDDVERLVFAATIHDADARKQSFGQVGNAFMRVYNNDDDQDLVRYDLLECFSSETAVIFGEICRATAPSGRSRPWARASLAASNTWPRRMA